VDGRGWDSGGGSRVHGERGSSGCSSCVVSTLSRRIQKADRRNDGRSGGRRRLGKDECGREGKLRRGCAGGRQVRGDRGSRTPNRRSSSRDHRRMCGGGDECGWRDGRERRLGSGSGGAGSSGGGGERAPTHAGSRREPCRLVSICLIVSLCVVVVVHGNVCACLPYWLVVCGIVVGGKRRAAVSPTGRAASGRSASTGGGCSGRVGALQTARGDEWLKLLRPRPGEQCRSLLLVACLLLPQRTESGGIKEDGGGDVGEALVHCSTAQHSTAERDRERGGSVSTVCVVSVCSVLVCAPCVCRTKCGWGRGRRRRRRRGRKGARRGLGCSSLQAREGSQALRLYLLGCAWQGCRLLRPRWSDVWSGWCCGGSWARSLWIAHGGVALCWNLLHGIATEPAITDIAGARLIDKDLSSQQAPAAD